MTASDVCFFEATELARLIRSREVSAREVMAAHLERIAALNPTLNAIVSKLDDGRCLELAEAADRRISEGGALPPLLGLPIAFKDLQPAVGFPFTRGSPIYRDVMPDQDSVVVERLRAAGAIPIGKTNVSEFGMGSHTYNPVYGTTVNPYGPTKSAGGSSGGAGAALAAGLLPLADGSDLAGSLRNPGSFNNVVGMRPSVGLVPSYPNELPFLNHSVNGPLARTVADAALLLRVMAGSDVRDPVAFPSDPTRFAGSLERDWRGTRVAWCPDLGGLPLDPRVRSVIDAQRANFATLGCVVEDACPDFAGADEIFLAIRAFRSATLLGGLLEKHASLMKPEAIWEIEFGLRLTSADLARALTRHALLLERVRRFQETHPFLVCAATQVPPFDAALDWPREIDGVEMEHYIAWMKSAYWITVTLKPAISVPAGFTTDGLPVGVQIVGGHHDDLGVLQLAHAFEAATGFGRRRPGTA